MIICDGTPRGLHQRHFLAQFDFGPVEMNVPWFWSKADVDNLEAYFKRLLITFRRVAR